MPRIRNRNTAKKVQEPAKKPTTGRTTRRRRAVPVSTPFNADLSDELQAKGRRLAELDEEVSALGAERIQITKDIERFYGELYGTSADVNDHMVGSFYAGFSEVMGKSTSTISITDYLEKLQELHGEEEGMEIFLKSATITKSAASKHMTSVALDEISESTKPVSKGVQFHMKKAKSTIK